MSPSKTTRFAFDDWEREAIEKAASDIDRQLTNQYTGRHGKRLESLLVHIDPKLRLGERDISRWSLIKPLISLEVAVNGQSVKVPLVPTRPHPNKSYVRMRPRRSRTGLFVQLEPSAVDSPVIITMVWKIQLSRIEGSQRSDVTIRHTQELIVTEQEVASGILSASAASFEDERYSPAEMAPVICYAPRDYVQGHEDEDDDLTMAMRHHPRFLKWGIRFEHWPAAGEGVKQILTERIPVKTSDLSHICFKLY